MPATGDKHRRHITIQHYIRVHERIAEKTVMAAIRCQDVFSGYKEVSIREATNNCKQLECERR